MQTLEIFNMLLSGFADLINDSDSSTKEKYEESLKTARQEIIKLIKQYRMIDPILSLIRTYDEEKIEESMVSDLLNRMIERANNRSDLDLVFTATTTAKVIQRELFYIPKYIKLSEKPHVLIKPYEDEKWEAFAIRMMTQIVMCSLMSLSRGAVRVNFINPSLSDKCNLITNNLPSKFCRIYMERAEISEFLDTLTNRIKDVLKTGVSKKSPKYELIVLVDYPYMFDGLTENMRIILEKGKQAGLHFVVLNDLRYSLMSENSFDILSLKDKYFQELGGYDPAKEGSYDHILYFTEEFGNQPLLLKACFNYLNTDTEDNSCLQMPYSENGYEIVDEGITVSIGKPIDSNLINFCLGQDGHVHSFIIGATGTGKSVLLHNIIIETISKYSPEDLQLYLLDCKLGGVEFNRYKDVKHVRALLVDNSDIQVVLEILRDLSEQMKERGKALRDAGVQKIDDYNHSHPGSKMSRIWVVIDECHVLFEQHNSNDRKAQTEIIDIITKVATEGRSQGVHLIMATQTLANTDIPTAILNNITDRYILNCAPVDAEKMWENSSRYINKLGQGDVYYHNISNALPDTQFHTFYHTPKEAKERIDKAIEKASDLKSNGQFYFDGSQIFNIDQETKDILTNARRGNLKAIPGKSINLKQTPECITLKQDMSENILVTGIDDQEQSTRTVMGLLCSLVISNTKLEHNYKFYVFDYKDDEEGDYQDVLEFLEKTNLVTIVRKRETGNVLKKLTDDIKNNNAEPSVLFLLGQQRFRGLKLDSELEERQNASNSIFGNNGFTSSPNTEIKTYKQALSYILDNGPEFHIHTVLQVDKPSNLLFEDYVTSKFVFKKFRHLIMLKSDDKAALNLGLPDEIRLDTLNSEPERLRAIYYADGDDGWTLFSPFAIPNKNELSNLTNKQ